uniref:Uncharacterized protein n=1 Tax=Setaria italica TaxID=4555 RepID=K3YKP8_SETIT
MFNSFISIGITGADMTLFYYFRALFYPSLFRKVDDWPRCSIESGYRVITCCTQYLHSHIR